MAWGSTRKRSTAEPRAKTWVGFGGAAECDDSERRVEENVDWAGTSKDSPSARDAAELGPPPERALLRGRWQ